MHRFALFALPISILFVGFACEDDSGTGGGATGVGPSGPKTVGSGPGSTGAGTTGDCTANADCPGGACVELTPGGFRTCQTDVQEAPDCMVMGTGGAGGGGGQGGGPATQDECCTSDDCNNLCVWTPLKNECGGSTEMYRACNDDDECETAADCDGAQICMPRGVYGNKIRVCLPVTCASDAECTAEAGGICAVVMNPCCDAPRGLHCVYPSTGCRSNADCGAGAYCNVMAGLPSCVQGAPNCP